MSEMIKRKRVKSRTSTIKTTRTNPNPKNCPLLLPSGEKEINKNKKQMEMKRDKFQ